MLIAKGHRIEVAPALVLDRNNVESTPLAPLAYYWEDLTQDLQLVRNDHARDETNVIATSTTTADKGDAPMESSRQRASSRNEL